MHPNSLANLKPPYKKGENGHGRVYPLKERLYHALDKPLTVPKKNAPVGEMLVYATLKGALDLIPTPFRETWDRVEGKVEDKKPTANVNVVFVIGKGYAGQTVPALQCETFTLTNRNESVRALIEGTNLAADDNER